MNRISRATAASILVFVCIALPRSVVFAALSPEVIIQLANGDRAAQGVPALAESPLLDEAAQMKADDMAAKGYYSHITPEGYTPLHWFDAVGYQYLNAGENLDLIYSGNEETINNAWMGSPEHRANILLPQFTEMGAGIAEGKYQGVEGVFAVEEFGTPMSPPVPLKPKPAPAPPSPLPVQHPIPIKMVTGSSSAPVSTRTLLQNATAAVASTPRWAIFQIQYSPERFAYALQVFILSIQESTRELLVQLSLDGVY